MMKCGHLRGKCGQKKPHRDGREGNNLNFESLALTGSEEESRLTVLVAAGEPGESEK